MLSINILLNTSFQNFKILGVKVTNEWIENLTKLIAFKVRKKTNWDIFHHDKISIPWLTHLNEGGL